MGQGITVAEFMAHGCVVRVSLDDIADENTVISIGVPLFYLRSRYGMLPSDWDTKLKSGNDDSLKDYAAKVVDIAFGLFMKVLPYLKTKATVKINFDGKEFYTKSVSREAAKRQAAHHRQVVELRATAAAPETSPEAAAEATKRANEIEDGVYFLNLLIMRALQAILEKYGFTNAECGMALCESDHETVSVATKFEANEGPSLPKLTTTNCKFVGSSRVDSVQKAAILEVVDNEIRVGRRLLVSGDGDLSMSGLPRVHNLSLDPETEKVQCDVVSSAAYVAAHNAPVGSLPVGSSFIGNDYNPKGIRGVGPKTFTKILKGLSDRNQLNLDAQIDLSNVSAVLRAVKDNFVPGVSLASLQVSDDVYQSVLARCKSGVVGLTSGPVWKKAEFHRHEKISFLAGSPEPLRVRPAGVEEHEFNAILGIEEDDPGIELTSEMNRKLARGLLHNVVDGTCGNEFLLVEKRLIEAALEGIALLPSELDPKTFKLHLEDGRAEQKRLRDLLFASLHEKAAARGEVARLTVTDGGSTHVVTCTRKDILTMALDAAFAVRDPEDGILNLIAEGIDANGVLCAFILRIFKVKWNDKKPNGYTIVGAWDIAKDDVQSLLFANRNKRLFMGLLKKDGTIVFPPSGVDSYIETGSVDELFIATVDTILDAADAFDELEFLNIKSGQLFPSVFNGVGYDAFVDSKDQIEREMKTRREFIELWRLRQQFSMKFSIGIKMYVEQGCPFDYLNEDAFDLTKLSLYSGVSLTLPANWNDPQGAHARRVSGNWNLKGGLVTKPTTAGAVDILGGKLEIEAKARERERYKYPRHLFDEAILRARSLVYDASHRKRDVDGVPKPRSDYQTVLNENRRTEIAAAVVAELSDEYLKGLKIRQAL